MKRLYEDDNKTVNISVSDLILQSHSKKQKTINGTSQSCIANDNVYKCELCGLHSIQEDCTQGHLSCRECGVITSQMIDDTAEWRNKTDNSTFANDQTRCNAIDDLLPRLSMSTRIAPSKNSVYEYRLSKLNQWQSGDAIERAIKVDFDFIDNFVYNRKCPFSKSILQTTKMLFKEYYVESLELSKESNSQRDCLRGNARKGLIGVCLFFACKIDNYHCTKEKIAEFLGIETQKIRKAKPIFLAVLQNKILDIDGWNKCISKISTVTDFIRTYQIVLGLPYYIYVYATMLYKCVKPTRVLVSKQPQSIAVTCIWKLASYLYPKLTIDDIITKCSICKATIKDVSLRMEPFIRDGLVYSLTHYCCEKIGMENELTIMKIYRVCLFVDNVTKGKQRINDIIAYSIQFVNVISFCGDGCEGGNVSINPNDELYFTKLCRISGCKVDNVISIAETFKYHKDSVIKEIY